MALKKSVRWSDATRVCCAGCTQTFWRLQWWWKDSGCCSIPGTPNHQLKMDVWWSPTISYVKNWNHPVETTIYKWLALGFQVEMKFWHDWTDLTFQIWFWWNVCYMIFLFLKTWTPAESHWWMIELASCQQHIDACLPLAETKSSWLSLRQQILLKTNFQSHGS